MSEPLLVSKLRAPSVPPSAVARQRLIERLDRIASHRVSLVSAPAGFGKSTLLAQWAGRCRLPLAWCSLDSSDDDPARFWRYFAAALKAIRPDLGESLSFAFQSTQASESAPIIAALANELATVEDDFVLILDDYHVVQSEAIQTSLAYLVEHLPRSAHLVIATRADPALPLPRLRARGQLLEVRADDLRFDPDETVAFLNGAMGLGLTAGDVAALGARTEGWVAGLQLAALALQTRHGSEDAGEFVRSFAGSHRFVLDYLIEEVLQRQPGDVQDFLVKTSVLSRLTGSLCDRLTGRTDGQATLERLEALNLFTVPLDDERRWYRYHNLFGQLLRSRLNRFDPDVIESLHARASAWAEEHGFLEEAIGHALSARDLGRVASLVERAALPLLLRGEMRTLLGWLSSLPEALVAERPWLVVHHAWLLLLTGRLAEVEPRLRGVVGWISSDSPDGRQLAGHVEAIRAFQAAYREDVPATLEHAQRALSLLPEDSAGVRAVVAYTLGGAALLGDNLEEARAAFARAWDLSRASGNSHVAVQARCSLAGVHVGLGELRRAAEIYRDTLQFAVQQGGPRSPVLARVYSGLSRLCYERNDLPAARRYAQDGVALSRLWGNVDSQAGNLLALTAVLLAEGELPGAQSTLEEVEGLAREHTLSPWFPEQLRAMRVRLWLAREASLSSAGSGIAEATRWARKRSADAARMTTYIREVEALAVARALVAEGRRRPKGDDLERAQSVLTALESSAARGRRVGRLIEILVLRALALEAQGHVGPATDALERALEIGEPEGFVRIYLDAGPELAALLRATAQRRRAGDFATSLLSLLRREAGGQDAAEPSPPRPGERVTAPQPTALAEPLSERELEVLRLIAAGRSNQQIARELVVAVSTVKSHANHVFHKLDATSRTAAVARARQLGLL